MLIAFLVSKFFEVTFPKALLLAPLVSSTLSGLNSLVGVLQMQGQTAAAAKVGTMPLVFYAPAFCGLFAFLLFLLLLKRSGRFVLLIWLLGFVALEAEYAIWFEHTVKLGIQSTTISMEKIFLYAQLPSLLVVLIGFLLCMFDPEQRRR